MTTGLKKLEKLLDEEFEVFLSQKLLMIHWMRTRFLKGKRARTKANAQGEGKQRGYKEWSAMSWAGKGTSPAIFDSTQLKKLGTAAKSGETQKSMKAKERARLRRVLECLEPKEESSMATVAKTPT